MHISYNVPCAHNYILYTHTEPKSSKYKQAQLLKTYPSKLRFISIQSLSSAIQSFVIAIAFERDIEQWKLGWNMRLLAVVYCVSVN